MSDVLGPVLTPPDRFALEQWLLKMPTALKAKLGIGSVTPGSKSQVTVVSPDVWEITDGVVTEAKQSLSDTTTNDVSTTQHGYAPKAPDDTDKFLRGDATWADAAGLLSDGTISDSATPQTVTAQLRAIQIVLTSVVRYLIDSLDYEPQAQEVIDTYMGDSK